ncbi:MAG: hypothetical protein M5U18_13500 [Dehalococcoidia bacterium]|nr:hypothetical protein [Dehalococcoidia bacterium]
MKSWPGPGAAKTGAAGGGFGDDEGAVETGHGGQEGADEEHEQGKVAEEGAVLAPAEAVGEEVGGAISFGNPFHAIAAAAQDRLDCGGAAFVGEVGAMVGAFEVGVGDGAVGSLYRAPGGPEAADGADGDGDDDEHPEPVEPGGVEDIEEVERVHGAGEGAVGFTAEFDPGGACSGVGAHGAGHLRQDDADHASNEGKPDEEQGELHVGEELPCPAQRIEAAGLDAGIRFAGAGCGGHRRRSSSSVS